MVELCEKDRENGNTKQITMFNDLVNSFLSNEKIYLKYTYKSPNPKTQNSNIYTAYTF
ncbi:MAG: hypothetical protein MJ223_02765 [Mycoplasmoidaceae bacterium]|nr:hypothetical protein [Mycoplasmoidaceae bacterium]